MKQLEGLHLLGIRGDGNFFWLFSERLGPVAQSIVSLTSSLRSQLVKCFTTL